MQMDLPLQFLLKLYSIVRWRIKGTARYGIYTPDSAINSLQLRPQGVYCKLLIYTQQYTGSVSVYSSIVNELQIGKYHNCSNLPNIHPDSAILVVE